MTSNDKYCESVDFERFCSILNKLANEDNSEEEKEKDIKIKENINSFPIDKRIRFLLNVLSSQQSTYTLKQAASSMLKELCTDFLAENDVSDDIVTEIKSCVFNLLVVEEIEPYQNKLLSVCVRVIKVVNKNTTNEWKVIMELVAGCLQSNNNPKLYVNLKKLLIRRHDLFGDEIKHQCEQYNLFFTECFKNITENQNLVWFAIGIFNEISDYFRLKYCFDTFSSLFPLMMKAMEAIVPTVDGMDFMEQMHCMLENWNGFSINFSQQILKSIIEIQNNSNIEKSVHFEIYTWVKEFINYFWEDVRRNCGNDIPLLIDNLLDFQIRSYPSNPEQWFTDICKSGNIFLLNDVTVIQSCLNDISTSIGSDIIYPILSKRVAELLKSPDWQQIDVAIEILNVLAHCFGQSVLSEPWEMFRTVSPYFSNDNPKIFYSTIKMTEAFCIVFSQQEFANFHQEALSSIIDGAKNQSCVYAKLLTIHVVDNIFGCCNCTNFDDILFGIMPLFSAVSDFISNTNDIDLMMQLTNSIDITVDCIYRILNCRNPRYIPEIIENIFKILDKIFYMPGFNYQAHCLIDCLYKRVPQTLSKFNENYIPLIVKHVEEFNNSHRLSVDCLEIRPCFFSLLDRLTKHKPESIVQLLPKLENSIIKYLSMICEFVEQRSNDGDLATLLKETPLYGCSNCFSVEYVGVVDWLCTLVATLVENYNKKQNSRYVESCMEIVVETLKKTSNESIYCTTTEGIYRLLNCAILYGDAEGIIKVWNSYLKTQFLTSIKNCSSSKIHKLINIFRKCINIPGFKNAITTADIQCIGEIFNNVILILIQDNEELVELENNLEKKNAKTLKILKSWIIVDNLDNLRKCIHDIITLYKEIVVGGVVPIFKTLMAYPKIYKWVEFFKFLLYVVDDILELMPPRIVDENGILSIVWEFSLDVLSMSSNDELKKQAIVTTKKLKNMYTRSFEKHFQVLDMTTKSTIEMLLVDE